MNVEHRENVTRMSLAEESELSWVFRALVLQSPVATWIADRNGTLLFENAANRRQLGIESDDEVVGKYNIFRDQEMLRQGLAPQIRRVFDEGGSAEFVIDYDFARVGDVSVAHPAHKILHLFIFAVTDGATGDRYVVVQHEDYTERVRTQKALQKSEARFRELVENTSDWVWEIDLAGRYTYSNGVVRQVLGYSPEEVVGRAAIDFICPEDHDRIRRALAEAIEKRQGFQALVHRMRHQDGTTRVIESSGRPVFDDEGNLIGFRGIDRDVTRRVEVEQALADAEAKYRSLVEESLVGVYIIQNGKFAYVNPTLAEVFGYDSPSQIEGMSPLELVAPQDRELVAENVRRRISGEERSIRYLLHGLRRDGEEIIVEVLGSRVLYRGQPAVIGSLLDITERVRAEEQVRTSEAELRALIAAMPDVIFVLDKDGKYVKIPPANPGLMYKPSEQMLGKTLHDVFPQACADRSLQTIRKALETGQTQHVEYPLVIDDREIWFSASVSPMDDGVVWVARDITEQKKAQEAERRRQQDLAILVDTLPGYAFLKNADGTYVAANQTFAHALGRTPEEVVGKTDYDLFPRDLADKYRADDRRLIESGKPLLVGEEEMIDEAGRITVLTRKVPLKDEEGNVVALIGLGVDVTELKRAEEAVRRSEENFRAIFNNAPALIVTYDQNAVVLEANQAFERFSGYTRDQLVGRSMFETFARPDVAEQKSDVIHRVFSGETVQDAEWVAVRPDGTKVYAITNTTPIYDSRGNVSKALSMGVDITERKQAEQYQRELDQHKREFYRRTILAATDGRLVISERSEIQQIAGPPLKTWDINSGEDLAAIRHDVMEIAKSAGMDEARVYDFVLAVGEMSTNAYKHAGSGQASIHKPDDELVFVVSDQGPGIEALTLPEVALVRGYSTAGTLGMGYKAVLSIAEKVYLATGPWGTTVAVAMNLHPAERPVAIPDTWLRQGSR